MTESGFLLRGLRDARLAAHALAPGGAWLWAHDGARVLWSNAAGAAQLGARTIPQLAAQSFDAADPLRQQMIELAARLPQGGAPRLERLRHLGTPRGQLMTCSCSQLAFPGGVAGLLVVAAAPADRPPALHQRLAALIEGVREPLALFFADGRLAAANNAALVALAGAGDMTAAGLDGARDALARHGRAEAVSERASFSLFRLGSGRDIATAAIIAPFAARSMAPRIGDAAVEPRELTVDGRPALSEAQTANHETPVTAPPTPHAAETRPQRFVWQIDADGRFSATGDAFTALVGAQPRRWREIAASADPDGRLATAMATGETFSNVAIRFPIESGHIEATLSGLPVFDAERAVTGYRGFGLYHVVRAAPAAAPSEPSEPPAIAPPQAAPRVTPADDTARNVVRFPSPEPRPPMLSPVENKAFDEIARQLSARLDPAARSAPEPAPPAPEPPHGAPPQAAAASAEPRPVWSAASRGEIERPLLERLPVGLLIYRLDRLLYANPAFLAATGHADLNALIDAGGLDALLIEPGTAAAGSHSDGGTPLTLSRPNGGRAPPDARALDARLFAISWDGDSALALVLVPHSHMPPPASVPDAEIAETRRERDALRAILDVITDAIVVVDEAMRILTCNRSAATLFGRGAAELDGTPLADLLAPESRNELRDHAERIRRADRGSPAGHGGEVLARTGDGRTIALALTMGRTPGDGPIFATFRDVSQSRAAEAEGAAARRQQQRAAAIKSDVLGKVSHEIRAPISSIIGFAELMIEERFGPLGNPRYATYLKDIRASAERVVAAIDDLADLSRVETGRIELTPASLALNELVEQCVAAMQPQANRERIIIRSSLAHSLPPVTADARVLRQIVLNLVATAIRLNSPGGQVIVSTALTDNGDVALRVRDTGAGLSSGDIAAALEPFRGEDGGETSGAGISLSLTRALVEANRARFDIRSAGHSGTLIEVLFSNATAR